MWTVQSHKVMSRKSERQTTVDDTAFNDSALTAQRLTFTDPYSLWLQISKLTFKQEGVHLISYLTVRQTFLVFISGRQQNVQEIQISSWSLTGWTIPLKDKVYHSHKARSIVMMIKHCSSIKSTSCVYWAIVFFYYYFVLQYEVFILYL